MIIYLHDTIRKENSVVTPVLVVADESFIKPTLMLTDASGRKTTVTKTVAESCPSLDCADECVT